jgi:hypothetical protein
MVYQDYKSFANSKHLAVAMGFAEKLWLDYLINLLLQLDDFPQAQLKDSLDQKYYSRFSSTGDSREARMNASAFVNAMNQLYDEVNFATYLNQYQRYYTNALQQLNTGLPGPLLLGALENFYQGQFASYSMIPSLLIPPGMGFGLTHRITNQAHSFHVFGALDIPTITEGSDLDMGFSNKKHLEELSTHEFGHPFVNPVIDHLPLEVFISTQTLFDPIQSVMAKQGYSTWKSCLSEHFVRAGEIMIAQNLGHRDDASRLKTHYIQDRHFIYLPIILQQLEDYKTKRSYQYNEAVERAMKKLQQRVTAK